MTTETNIRCETLHGRVKDSRQAAAASQLLRYAWKRGFRPGNGIIYLHKNGFLVGGLITRAELIIGMIKTLGNHLLSHQPRTLASTVDTEEHMTPRILGCFDMTKGISLLKHSTLCRLARVKNISKIISYTKYYEQQISNVVSDFTQSYCFLFADNLIKGNFLTSRFKWINYTLAD